MSQIKDGMKNIMQEVFYVPEQSFMYLTVSRWFLISFVFKFTALCTILPHCVQSYRSPPNQLWALEAPEADFLV